MNRNRILNIVLKPMLSLVAFLMLQLPSVDGQIAPQRDTKKHTRYIFNNIISLDGLSSNNVTYTLETQNGTLVMCTQNGLNIYSNGRVQVFTHNPNNPQSIPDNHIRFAADYVTEVESIRRLLWIGTDKGLCRYDASNNSFQLLYNEDGNTIDAVNYEVIDGAIVFITSTGEIYKLDIKTQTVKFVAKPRKDIKVNKIRRFISDNQFLLAAGEDGLILINTADGSSRMFCERDRNIYAQGCFFDLNGNVWLCSNHSVIKYNSRGRELARYEAGRNGITECEFVGVVGIDDKIWVGTRGDGIVLIDINTGEIESIRHISGGNRTTIPGNYINHIIDGIGQYIWVSTYRNGVVGIKETSIVSYSEVQRNSDSGLSNQTVLCMYDDYENNQILIGTAGGGVNFYNTRTETFRHLPVDGGKNIINSIVRLDSHSLLVAVASDGAYVLDDRTGNILRAVRLNDDRLKSVFDENAPIALHKDIDGSIFFIGKEIFRYHPYTNRIEMAEANPASGKDAYIFAEEEEAIRFYADNTIYTLNKSDMSISADYVNHYPIIAAAEGVLGHLVIVDRDGLSFRDPATNEFQELNPPFQYRIAAIQIDNRRRLWVASDNTIMCNTNHTPAYRIFSTADGVVKSSFFNHSTLVSRDGDVYFGGERGMTRIIEDIDIESIDNPKMRILSWQCDAEFTFIKDQDNVTGISLPNNYHDITVRVSALGYDVLRKNFFKFSITGPTNTEITTDNDSYNFNMSKQGTYYLRVSCSTDKGLWTEPELLAVINIERPWWLQWWMFGSLLAILLAVGIAIVRNRLEAKKRMYEDMLKQNEIKEQQSKLNIFTDISHELRTPLTLVYSPMKRLIEELPDNNPIRQRLEQMLTQVDRLIRLTNMVLDVRKMELGFDNVVYTDNSNVNEWLCSEVEVFRNELADRRIDLKFELNPLVKDAVFDKSKIKIVISNLMSNAVKYSNPDTTVTVRSQIIKVDNVNLWRVSVVDVGIGLGGKEASELFERFSRGNNVRGVVGYGVGLSYSNDIIRLHRGYMSAFDSGNETTFYFDIPLDLTISQLQAQDNADNSTAPELVPTTDSLPVVENENDKPLAPIATELKGTSEIDLSRLILCTLLIAEDDRALRDYMKDEFSKYFRKVYTAVDGRDGIDKVRSLRPDIIISDVVMPNLSGFDMCRMIKTDLEISHIPVLLLTARTDAESVAMGYKMGADMYMSKPFDVDNMIVILYNHLQRRDSIRRKYSQTGTTKLDVKELSFSNADEYFLDRLNNIIIKNLDNTQLDINFIVSEMGLSRTNFYAKLKVIVDITPIAYINKLRIQRAIELLQTSDNSIADISTMVGFADHAYFSQMFKESTGFTPSDYRNGNKKKRA